jgi:hypothetical protein
VRFVLSTPGVHAFCTPGDVNVLRVALAAAQDLGPVVDREAAVAAVAHEPMIFPIPS